MGEEIKDTILLINMFSGDYLVDHFAHEMINIFKTDDEVADGVRNYIYVPDDGRVNPNVWDVEKVIMVRHLGLGRYEVIGCAKGLKNISQEGQEMLLKTLKYGGKSLQSIMTAAGQPFDHEKVTFEASYCMRPTEPLYIDAMKTVQDMPNELILKQDSQDGRSKAFSMRQRRYFKPDDKIYACLDSLLTSSDYSWEEFPTFKEYDLQKQEEVEKRFLSLINKEDSELAYSNLIAHFLNENDGLCRSFLKLLLDRDRVLKKLLGMLGSDEAGIQEEDLLSFGVIDEVTGVSREKDHIDLLIDTKNARIILENKVNSGLDEGADPQAGDVIENGRRIRYAEDGQLQRYVKAIAESLQEKELMVFTICPSRNELFQEYEWFMNSNGKDGLLRMLRLKRDDESEMEERIPVPVVSYGEIHSVFKKHIEDYQDETREKIYFEDLVAMLDQQDKRSRSDLSDKFLDSSCERFSRAIKRAS